MKVYLRTFGCRANHYDSERVRALALAAGHEIVADDRAADVAIFNSCAVTAEAERDVRKAVRRTALRNPRLRSAVMGCAAALPESVPSLRALPTVEAIAPGADLAEIAAILDTPADASSDTRHQTSVRAVLRIQDGCDQHCTFCVTTHARGSNRSRPVEELVRESRALAEHHPEIVLAGTHIGTYGADTGSSLGALVETLIDRVPAARFRLSSIEATEVDARLAGLFGADPARLAPHLHAPLQSGSDRMLRRMGRHWYTARRYAAAVEALCAGRPVFGLGADVIVGFPGETDADFADTVAIVEALPFTYLHVFPFSARPGTAAKRLPGAVPAAVIQERAARLRQLGEDKGRRYQQARSGSVADLVVVKAGARREAITEDFLAVHLAAPLPRGERFRGRLAWTGDLLRADETWRVLK